MASWSMSPTLGYTIHTAEATLDPGNVGAGGPHVTVSLESTTGVGGSLPRNQPGARLAARSPGFVWAAPGFTREQ